MVRGIGRRHRILPNGWIDSSEDGDDDYKILEAVCTLNGPDQFGAISDGYLTVYGKLISVRWSQMSPLSIASNSNPAQPEYILFKEGREHPINFSYDLFRQPSNERRKEHY